MELGLALRLGSGRYRLVHPARSFGGTLEWYVARELQRRLGFDVLAGLKFRQPGVGGDLDLVAAAEGRLAYLELKSSPPRHLSEGEVAAFFDRLQALRPDLALFAAMDPLEWRGVGTGVKMRSEFVEAAHACPADHGPS